MDYSYRDSLYLKDLLQDNSQEFEQTLLDEAVNVRDKIDEILRIGNIDLVNNAHKLVLDIIEGKEQAIADFAKQEGIAWATQSIDLSFKLEWVQAIRRTLWKFIQECNSISLEKQMANFFILEKDINSKLDGFLNAFFISYSKYKDELIKSQRELVENLSVPIIPINPSVGILPLIGSIDVSRAEILEEKVLSEIGKSRIQTLVVDFSGVAEIDSEIIGHLKRIIDSISYMGCNTVITGLRMEVAKKITQLGISFGQNTRTLGTLHQALKENIGSFE
ncbi:STAS domain-containing protein [Radiobacillus sp. PE A8.2]|uniref:STAS domain-containing protein n=1 Tax=Radiobacillus sp. PE A8.2 TaxID=3380349 RepID=UPI00388EDD9F